MYICNRFMNFVIMPPSSLIFFIKLNIISKAIIFLFNIPNKNGNEIGVIILFPPIFLKTKNNGHIKKSLTS